MTLSIVIVAISNAFLGLSIMSRIKAAIITSMICMLFLSWVSFELATGQPRWLQKTIISQLQEEGSMKLISRYIVRGQGIYLWMLDENNNEPYYVAIPYSEELARQLEAAIEIAEGRGMPIELDLDTLKNLYLELEQVDNDMDGIFSNAIPGELYVKPRPRAQ